MLEVLVFLALIRWRWVVRSSWALLCSFCCL